MRVLLRHEVADPALLTDALVDGGATGLADAWFSTTTEHDKTVAAVTVCVCWGP
jgi:hypothetical protein